MKTVKMISSALIASALIFGNASAMKNPEAHLKGIVGVNTTQLSLRIDDGVATLFGNVESRVEAHLAKGYVEKMDGVDKVIDLVTIN